MIVRDAADAGLALRVRREAHGLTQAAAASLSGVSTRLWLECESGKRAQVGFETLLRMFQTVGADLEVRPRERPMRPGGAP